MGLKTQHDSFLDNDYDFDQISSIVGDHVPKYNCTGCNFRTVIVHTLAAKTRNVNVLEIRFTVGTDFIFVRYCNQ